MKHTLRIIVSGTIGFQPFNIFKERVAVAFANVIFSNQLLHHDIIEQNFPFSVSVEDVHIGFLNRFARRDYADSFGPHF